jgi:hypothetical protein
MRPVWHCLSELLSSVEKDGLADRNQFGKKAKWTSVVALLLQVAIPRQTLPTMKRKPRVVQVEPSGC